MDLLASVINSYFGRRSYANAVSFGWIMKLPFGSTKVICVPWEWVCFWAMQLQYAALDAACLLGVLELYLQALNEKPPQQSSVSSPKQNAQSSETDTHVTASPSLEESSDPVHLRDECTETQSRIDTVGCSTSVSQCLSVESLENDLQNKLNWSEHPPVEDLRIERVQDRQTSEGLFGRNISPCDNEEQEDLSDCAQSQHGQNGAETSSLEEPNFEASISGYHLSESKLSGSKSTSLVMYIYMASVSKSSVIN